MGASWLPLWLAVVVAREARWAPQRELERRHPDDALNASARVRRELERTVDAYPKARSDEDALRLARQALAATQHFVLLWQNRIFCAADHLHADKHKIHYMFSLIASMAERAPLPNALFVWDQGARGTGCPPGAPETPCFVIAKVSGYGARGILVPNPYFCHLRFWDDRAGRIRGAAALRPFAGRDPRLFWRGGVTRSCNPGNVARVAAISLTSDDATAFDVRCTSCQPPNSDACGGAFNYTASMRHLADGRNRSLFVEPHDFAVAPLLALVVAARCGAAPPGAAVRASEADGAPAAPRRGHHPYVVVSSQRSGSLFVMDELKSYPCVVSHSEMFLNRGGLEWDGATLRGCLRTFAAGGALPGAAAPITAKFQVMLNQTLRQEAEAARGGYAVATGFKWMLSQRAGRHWPWFVELCRDFGVRLVFLLRRNAARQLVSRLLNAEDKARAQAGGLRHSAHPNSESRLDELRSRRVTFRRDQVLEQLQDMREKWTSSSGSGSTRSPGACRPRVVYEDVDADHSLVGNLSDFLLADVGAEERANCAAAFASRPPPQGHEKIHSSLEDLVNGAPGHFGD
ncbi:hypothetical protein JL722_13842 [Aureococcus anophagefferens]|nr:hypothetical protein JL722_13842 [Aureococcus anophagefferens]